MCQLLFLKYFSITYGRHSAGLFKSLTRQMRTIIWLLLCTVPASAFECTIVSSRMMINVGSEDLCNYAIYHFVMFAICGTIAIVAMLATCMNILYRGDRETVESRLTLACSCCGLSLLGFEGPLVLIIFAICIFDIYIFLRVSVLMLLSFCTRRVVPVVSLTEIVVEPDSQHLEDIVLETPVKELTCDEAQQRGEMVCPICLQTSSTGEGGWGLTDCGHVFHTACLLQWTAGNRSCPYCRAELLFR